LEISSEAGSEESGAMKKSELINWYLNEISGDIESEAELIEKKVLVEKVLDRLIYNDQVIIPLTKSGLKGSRDATEDEEDPLLVVHPNYIIEA